MNHSWEWGDPERVLIRRQEEAARQAKACGQCVHKQVQQLEGKTIFDCSKRQDYGRRCRFFRIFNTNWSTK
jgi:hypothetical protein